MNNSIIFFDSKSKLINPNDVAFDDENLVEIFIEQNIPIDQVLTRIIYAKLMNNEFTNIIIPVCFGETLSDFLGLRLATHIRCTPSVNQEKNIFLYSFTGIKDYFSNECFNILKTKGVFLIDYNVESILQSSKNEELHLSTEHLVNEVSKLKLDIPLNYEDSHSLANEWAIYKWAKMLETNDEQILKIETKLENDLYFKYLKISCPDNTSNTLTKDELILNYKDQPSILYIDDDAEKGWREIFEKIMFEVNDIDFLHLDDEFNEKSKKEIIDISMDKIKDKNENVDIVILDFRLHKSDFDQKSIGDITGYQILKEIKEYNKGIQIIVFSATNKIWNLQALQKAGADGFIMKESPETSLIEDYTLQSLKNMLRTIDLCLERGFLKDFYIRLEELKEELIPRKNFKKSSKPLPKEFVDETLKWLELSCDVLAHDIREVNITSSFLFMFSVLENLANLVIDSDNPKKIESSYNGQSSAKFEFEFRENNRKLKWFKENKDLGQYEKTDHILQSSKGLPWIAKILNTLDFINNGELPDTLLSDIIKKRNDIVHANSTTGNVIGISKDILKTLNEILYKGLKGL